MGVFGSSGQVHRHIKKLRWLFRYPRSEPYSMTWLVPHQIKLICGTARGARGFSIDFARADGAFICTALKHGT